MHHDFDDNLLMDELDIDEILECDDIEQTALFNSSKQLLSAFDNIINSIDDRINFKRHAFYGDGANAYYGPNNNPAPGYREEYYGSGSFSHNNLYMGPSSHGYHKQQSQSTNINRLNHNAQSLQRNGRI